MPRRGRVLLANTPHHIVQRGHNRNSVFVEPADYEYYLENLIEWKSILGVKVYAFCLMTNHIHLIVDPGDYPTAISELMKRLASRQTRFVNKQEKRCGSIWEGRYKISPIETNAYLLQCCRYVELNPVKARMVNEPAEYSWSSYRHKIGAETLSWLDLDPIYLGLGENPQSRQMSYQTFVSNTLDAESEQGFIQVAAERNQLTGSCKFIDEVESRIGIRIEQRGPGRPSRAKK